MKDRTEDGIVKAGCDITVTKDAEFTVRHFSTRFIPKERWLFRYHPTELVRIGRTIPEALGLNTRSILEVASDRHKGILNIPEIRPF